MEQDSRNRENLSDSIEKNVNLNVKHDHKNIAPQIAIFGNDQSSCSQISQALAESGLQVPAIEPLETLLKGPPKFCSGLVFLNLISIGEPLQSKKILLAFSILDRRLFRLGGQLIILADLPKSEDIFSAFKLVTPILLPSPTPAERVVEICRLFLGETMATVPKIVTEERLILARLSRKIDTMVETIEKLHALDQVAKSATSNEFVEVPDDAAEKKSPEIIGSAFSFVAQHSHDETGLPNPKIVRAVIANRRAREKFFDPGLFADAAWDMLLDLTAAEAESRKVSVTSLCIASGVPTTTALRWVRHLVDIGLFCRTPDPSDARRFFIVLGEEARESMTGYFKSLIPSNALIG